MIDYKEQSVIDAGIKAMNKLPKKDQGAFIKYVHANLLRRVEFNSESYHQMMKDAYSDLEKHDEGTLGRASAEDDGNRFHKDSMRYADALDLLLSMLD